MIVSDNKKAHFLMHLFVFFAFTGIMAQSVDDIENSLEYYFDKGTGINHHASCRNTLAKLSETISMQIQNTFEKCVIYTCEDIETYTESVVLSCSDALHSASSEMGFTLDKGFAATELSQLHFLVEYQGASKAHFEPEVNMIVQNEDQPYFEFAGMCIDLMDKPLATAVATGCRQQSSFASTNSLLPDYEVYHTAVKQVIDAILNHQHHQIENLFTPLGYDLYWRMVNSWEVTVPDNHVDTLRIMQVGREVMVRSVPMMFAFHNNRDRFIENVVFTFNLDGKISGISYALGDIAINDILNKPAGFGSKEIKYFMIKFIEDYKTAIVLQRLDYLDSIFDVNAQGVFNIDTDFDMQKINIWNSEYISVLRQIYKQKEYINNRIENIEVRRAHRSNKVYGIQFTKHYNSESYANKGYLFFLLDIEDMLNPSICFSVWQPEKNPDGSIYGLEDFRF